MDEERKLLVRIRNTRKKEKIGEKKVVQKLEDKNRKKKRRERQRMRKRERKNKKKRERERE